MPTEAENTLRSRAKLKVIDLLGQGPIGGLVKGAGSIYLNGTPILNNNGSTNFPNFDYARDVQQLFGTPTQGHMSRFPAIENEVAVGIKVTKDSPEGAGSGDGSVTRTITDPDTDAVRVTLRVPALSLTNTTTGDIAGTGILFKIESKVDGGNFVPAYCSQTWAQHAPVDDPTPDGIYGIEISASAAREPGGFALQFQYKKSDGDWITYRTAGEPSGLTGNVTSNYVMPITGLTPGIYQARVLKNGSPTTMSKVRVLGLSSASIAGKTTSPYDVSYRIPLPAGGAPWDIKITRITDDNTESNINDDLYWYSYTEIIDNKLSMPNMAAIGLVLNADDFGGQIPKREYEIDGRNTIKVPVNYNPQTRNYSGLWNGTFKEAWTDNPAWIFYDLLTNKRYGLGDNIDESHIDKYGLYVIAQYCDELVDAPYDGQEPRYTINTVINSQQEAYNLLASIASVFRGMIYWSGGSIHAVADMPTDPTVFIGPANVIDGTFTYQGASMKARHTVARVAWNNPDDGYKLNIESYEDLDAIRRYGYRPIDVNAVGCTSRGQARRCGKWMISTDIDNSDTVTYRASFDHFAVRPGDVVSIADPDYSGVEMSGRLVSVTDNEDGTHTLEFDRDITLTAAETSTLYVCLPSGDVAEIDVTSSSTVTDSEIIIDDVDLPEIPIIGEFWQLKTASVEPRLWRVFSVVEAEKNIYQVSAMYYDPNKFDKVESDLNFAEADFTAYPSGELAAPTGVNHSEYLRQTGAAITSNVVLSWTRPADSRAEFFEVQYQLDGSAWQAAEPNITRETSIDILNTQVAVYNFRVRTQDAAGIFRSPWTVYSSVSLLGKEKPPEDVTGFDALIEKYGVLLEWNPVSDIDLAYYEIRLGGTGWNDSTFVTKVKATTYKYEDKNAGDFIFRIKAVDSSDNESNNAASATATGEVQNVPMVTTKSIPIGIQVDIDGELKRGFSHWELRRRVYSTQIITVFNERITTRIYFDESYDDLQFGEAYEYSARAVDANGVASSWSAFSSPVFPLQIQSNDITANQIIGKDFRTAENVGEDVDGVKFNGSGIQMWQDGIKKVDIPVTGDPTFTGTLTAGAGYIGGWQIFPGYIYSENIKLDSTGAIQTLNFVSGNRGWSIDKYGDAEFNNIRARGAVKTVVFEKDEISVVGGRTLIRPAELIAAYDYVGFINTAGNATLEDQWGLLNEILDTSETYVAAEFADYDEYTAAEAAYYREIATALDYAKYTAGIIETDYSTGAMEAYFGACWTILNTILDTSVAAPAFSAPDYASFVGQDEEYFDYAAETIDNPPAFESTITANSTAITLVSAEQFNLGDIIRIKDGLSSDYWGAITAIDGSEISIEGKSGELFEFTAGQPVVCYGGAGAGGILLDGQSPLIDIYTHDGEPWNGTDNRVRIGNLKGWGPINHNTYGIAIGQPDSDFLVYDNISGILTLKGAINITSGVGLENFSDAGALATKNNIDLSYVSDAGALAGEDTLDGVPDGATYKRTTTNEKTGAGRAYTGLDASNRLVTAVIPATAVSPSGSGLYLGSNYMGFYNSGWKTYMDNSGNFALVGSGVQGMSWNASAGTLAIRGVITVESGSNVSAGADVTATVISSGLVTTGTIQVRQGGTDDVAAGMTGNTLGDDAVRIWAGSTFANRVDAPFRVLQNGALFATSATISGTITATAGAIADFQIVNKTLTTTAVGATYTEFYTIYCDSNGNPGTLSAKSQNASPYKGAQSLQQAGEFNCNYYDGTGTTYARFGGYGYDGTNAGLPVISISMRSTEYYAINTNGKIQGDTIDTSDERLKSGIASVTTLDKLKALSVTEWHYDDDKIKLQAYDDEVVARLRKGEGVKVRNLNLAHVDYKPKERHIGPMAADFNKLFGVSNGSETGINLSDGIGVALRAIQELAEIVDDLKSENAELRAALNLPVKAPNPIEITEEEISHTLDKYLEPAAAKIWKEYEEFNKSNKQKAGIS